MLEASPEVATGFDMWDVHQTGPDPHSLYREMRGRCPVGHSAKHGGFTFTVDFATMNAVAVEPEMFSNNPGVIPPMHLERPMVPLMIDPPEHRPFRRVLNPFFTVARLTSLEADMRRFCAELCNEFAARGECDAVQEYAAVIPMYTLSKFFQVPEELRPSFVDWASSMVHDVQSDPTAAAAAGANLAGAITGLLAQRREQPREGDLLSELATGVLGGVALTPEDIMDICLVMVLAGADTTQHAIANSLRLLAERPDLRRRLCAEPDLMESAIEEFLRYDGPVQFTARRVTVSNTVAGPSLEVGDNVALVWAAGNRDSAVFEHPDEVVLDRNPNRHVAFGTGIHRCLGANLAKLEMRVALEEFLAVIPDFHATDDLTEPEKWVTGIVRGPKILPLRSGNPG